MELVRDRNMRLLLAGEALSLLGDRAMYLALAIWVKTLTGSSSAAGLVFFALAIPGLAAPLAGFVVDRARRRWLMVATDLGIAAVLLTLVTVHGRDRLWLIYAVTVAYGAAGALLGSARSALLTELLPARLLPSANAALQTASEGMRLVAPLAGAGLFVLLGGGAVAALDAATFVVAAACLVLIRHEDARPAPREHHLWQQLIAGAVYIAHTRPLRQIVLAVAVALLVVGFAETVVFAVIDQGLHRPPSFLGVLSAAQGVGAIAGAVVAPRLLRRFGDALVVAAGMALFGLGDAAMIVSRVPVVVAGIAVAGAGISWAVVGFGTAVQTRTPPGLQGRVYSTADTLLGAPQTLSIAVGAGLAAVVDYRWLLVVMAAVTVASCAVLAIRADHAAARPHYTPPDALEPEPLDPDDGGRPRASGGVRPDGARERVHPDSQ